MPKYFLATKRLGFRVRLSPLDAQRTVDLAGFWENLDVEACPQYMDDR